jgi:hypothetical protein
VLPARVSTLMLLLQWRAVFGTKLVVKFINNSDELRVQKINLHDKCREAGLSFPLLFLIEVLTNAEYGAKTPFLIIENKRFGLVFTKKGVYQFGH